MVTLYVFPPKLDVAMGCVFCASTQGGLFRDLSVPEIVGQVVLFSALKQEDIHSLVVMGAG